MSDEKPMGQVIQIDEARIRDHLGEMVRGTVEETLNAMLDAEADRLCGAGRYERNEARGALQMSETGRSLSRKKKGPAQRDLERWAQDYSTRRAFVIDAALEALLSCAGSSQYVRPQP
jgi:hypothetical protein